MITVQKLKLIDPLSIFASGIDIDNEQGINIASTNKLIKWVAVKGQFYTWCIYVGMASKSYQIIRDRGLKISLSEARTLLLAPEQVFELYQK